MNKSSSVAKMAATLACHVLIVIAVVASLISKALFLEHMTWCPWGSQLPP